MPKANQHAPMEGDKCPLCGEGTLAVSSSGRNLVCPKCGRIAMLDDRPEPKAKVGREA
jgi:tRNA(Ile2) C34 agmatinyltransferase TiaS